MGAGWVVAFAPGRARSLWVPCLYFLPVWSTVSMASKKKKKTKSLAGAHPAWNYSGRSMVKAAVIRVDVDVGGHAIRAEAFCCRWCGVARRSFFLFSFGPGCACPCPSPSSSSPAPAVHVSSCVCVWFVFSSRLGLDFLVAGRLFSRAVVNLLCYPAVKKGFGWTVTVDGTSCDGVF
jgi:hypothetical protein